MPLRWAALLRRNRVKRYTARQANQIRGASIPPTMPTIDIRNFQPDDAETLWTIFYEAVRQTAAADYSPVQVAAWAPTEHDSVLWAERMTRRAPLVAWQNGRVVGYADVQADGHIDHFFVAPPARQGVGSALMRAILERAAERNIPELYSEVSITARPFFERFGFVVEAAQQVTVRGVVFDNFRMRRKPRPTTGNR
jgi:putative acetyltransferase